MAIGRRLLLLLCACAGVGMAGRVPAQPVDPTLFAGMHWRLVGPFRGGRTVTATGVPGQPNLFYFGAVGGGVWKSENAGRTWEPIFDSQPIASIGALAVAPSDPNVIYVGSGEADMRSDISYGNGMYKSVDAGKTWTRIGLTDTRQIGRIAVDARDPNLVFVAALGHAYGPNKERGVFRSKDGGKTWTAVLFKDENTGAIDLAFDPSNNRTILAALWQTRRPPWNVYPPSNGPGSGLYRSEDGGDTWKQVTSRSGFPSEKLGRIRIAFAPSEPRRVYALVDADAKEGGLYVSEDKGVSWKRASSDRRIWDRGWYFGGVTVDPQNPDTVYACSVALYRSTDGGKTFLPFKGAPGGDDYHRLWIDPADSRRMIVASDQGAVVTVDGGRTWSSWYNQPTGQFYHVVTDGQFPYWIYGAQQDSGAAATPSQTDYRSIMERDWKEIAAGGENDFIAPDPQDPDILWGGRVERFDRRTLQNQNVDPTLAYPGGDPYRSEWTLPLAISPREAPPRAIYFANQFLFKTVDAGRHWEKQSPDLTRENPGLPGNLDPVTAADSAVKGPRRGVIYAIALSPLDGSVGRIWCGTDDGLIWLSRDDGKNWKNVTPKGLTAWSKVAIIEASHFEAETAYAAIDRHRLDDLTASILRTRDGGKTWSQIARGIPSGSFVNVVREDPVRRGLLYAGTETGVFVSFDEGNHWQPLQLNLPNCSIRDIDVRHGDLVVATHGRSFWVLDDLSPLRQIDAMTPGSDLVLLAPRPAVRLHPEPFQGTPEPRDEPMGENPPRGAVLDYYLKGAASGPLSLDILDANGTVVRHSASDSRPRPIDLQRIQTTPDWAPVLEPPSAAAGMHRFVWDLHDALPDELVSPSSTRSAGLWAPPGQYAVRLTVAGKTVTQSLVVARDPRLPSSITDLDLVRQHELSRDIQAERVRVAVGLRQADALRKQIATLRQPGAGAKSALDALDAFAKAVDRAAGPPILLPGEEFFDTEEVDPTSLRRLSFSLSGLQSAVESADAAPTPDAISGFAERRKLVTQGLARWQDLLASDLPKANRSLEAAGLSPLKTE
jgi:photosystem II stability/assembly factor-like uncharacterized protein